MAEWIDVNERLPEKSGQYVVCCMGSVTILPYSAKYKLFNAYDDTNCDNKYALECTHWMPLPEPPNKGE